MLTIMKETTMATKVRNIVFETDGKTVKGLPTEARYEENLCVTGINKELENETGWLCSGFDWRIDDGEWRQHREDMSWRETMIPASVKKLWADMAAKNEAQSNGEAI